LFNKTLILKPKLYINISKLKELSEVKVQTRFPKDTLPFAEQTRFQRLTLDKVAT